MRSREMEIVREEVGSRQEAGSLDPADLLRAELLAVEPSPGFAAGVRQRIEARGRVWTRLTLTLALATTAFALVAGGAYLMNRREAAVPLAPGPVAQAVEPRVTPEPVARPATKPTLPRRTSAQAKPVTVAAAKTSSGPFLEVITNQPEIIRRIWAGIDGGIARVGLPENEFEEITVPPVRVDAIVVPKIGPPGGGGTPPEARRVTGDNSARGDQR